MSVSAPTKYRPASNWPSLARQVMSALGGESVLNSMGSQGIVVCVRSKWPAKQFYKKDHDGIGARPSSFVRGGFHVANTPAMVEKLVHPDHCALPNDSPGAALYARTKHANSGRLPERSK